MSLSTTAAGYSPPPSATQSHIYGNGSDFQFNFPKFGDLPASFLNNGSITKSTSPTHMSQRSASASSITPPGTVRKQSSSASNAMSSSSSNGMFSSPRGQPRSNQVSNDSFNDNNYDHLNGMFSPSILENASRNSSVDYLSYSTSKATSTPNLAKAGDISSVNGHAQNPTFNRHPSSSVITGSPASSMSHGALDSSCGTTPESSAESPRNHKSSEGGLTTFDEGKDQSKGRVLLKLP